MILNHISLILFELQTYELHNSTVYNLLYAHSYVLLSNQEKNSVNENTSLLNSFWNQQVLGM